MALVVLAAASLVFLILSGGFIAWSLGGVCIGLMFLRLQKGVAEVCLLVHLLSSEP